MDAHLDEFRYYSGSWDSSTINACVNDNPDAVGIDIKARHDLLTGFFGDGVNIEDHSVMQFEPLPNVVHARTAGPHP